MTSSGISDKFKNAFKVGGRKKDNVEDIQPLAHGAHGKADPVAANAPGPAMAAGPNAVEPRSAATHADGHRSVGTAIKDTFTSAPWSDHHDKTLEALTHAKEAHAKAMQAQASLKAAAEAKHKADTAQGHLEELDREYELHRQGHDGIGNSKKDYDDARTALAEHTKTHDHHNRLAREAAEAAAAKEAELNAFGPKREEHARALAPLQKDHAAITKSRGEAERRREALMRELQEIEAQLGPLRTKEAEHVRMLEDHKRLGAEHEKRGASLAEEMRLLRAKADEHHRGLEPHAQRLKSAHALVATKESDYAKAQKAHEAARDRLPVLEQQREAARREAKEAAVIADKHASAFEKLKREAEAEDAKKAHLWDEARKRGHIEEDGASKQELHKLADRFHTVLKNPIDTTHLSGNGIADEIHQAAAKISGRGAGENAVADKAATPATGGRAAAVDAPKTPEKGSSFQAAPMADPFRGPGPKPTTAATEIAPKRSSVTTPAHTTVPVEE